MLYESMLAFAIMVAAAAVFPGAAGGVLSGWKLALLSVHVFVVLGLYFVWCWTRGGQTLPMKTWKLRLVRADGSAVPAVLAFGRYAVAYLWLFGFGGALLWAVSERHYAVAALALAGLCGDFLWALVDRDRQFLHDRLAGTRVVAAAG
jgi:uncharacterized RDD family membrane protein YckC